MKAFRLRPHHIDALIARKNVSSDERRSKILATARLYGDRGFANREREFIESVNGDTSVRVILGNDYICTQLRCPFEDQCRAENYQEVARALATNLPNGPVRELALQLTPEISDRWSMRRYGLEVGRTYRLKDIKVINPSMSIDDLE